MNRRLQLVGGGVALLLLVVAVLALLRSSDSEPQQRTGTGTPVALSLPPNTQSPQGKPQTPVRVVQPVEHESPKANVETRREIKAEAQAETKPEATREAEPQTKVETKPGVSPEVKPAVEEYNPRALVARSLLLQAKQAFAATPDDPWTYQDRLKAIVADHQSTDAGKEAATLLAELKVGPRPTVPTGEQAEGLVIKPGLWARHYAGPQNNRRMKLCVGRPLTSLEQNSGGGGPAQGVPGDNFETEAMGVLRISDPGEYTFVFIGDDFLDVWIDGKCIGNAQWDRQVSAKVNLSAGDHTIKVVHSDSVSNSSFRLVWKRPGHRNEETIPAGALFHYGKPEEK